MNNLKKIMKAKGINVLDMSIRTGYSKKAIYSWINCDFIPGLYAARVAADYLKVTDREIWP